MQNIIFSILANENDVTINFVFVPNNSTRAETQAMFHESIKNNFTLSFDSWYTDRKVVKDVLESKIVIGSAQNVNSPKYLKTAH